MLKSMPPNYFFRQASFRLRLSSIFIFIIASSIVWLINFFGQVIFPSQNLLPFFVRTTITLVTDIVFIIISVRLLKQNYLSAKALGLHLSAPSLLHVLIGTAIGMICVTIIGGLLYFFIPYHFVRGPLGEIDVLKISFSYLSGNMFEELVFRGFLLIILSQLVDWRLAILILALPFGLFHLQGTGFNSNGFSMMVTTAAYSFVFALSFVATGSLWAAIAAHTTANIFLHLITGLDGIANSIYLPVFEKNWPASFDAGLWVAVVSVIIVSALLYMVILRRFKPHTQFYQE